MGTSHASKNPMTLSQSNTYQDRIQHLEYNEAKPTYERCSKDKMKCDGYLPPKPPKPPRRRAKPKAAPAKLAVNRGLSAREEQQYDNLCLHQKYWQMVIDSYARKDDESGPTSKVFGPSLVAARKVAAPIIALQ
ncbi:hypothetical protein FOFC_02250 [Fusarium oxysporum]|nr:hypothetical protein FOFC_12086 [Fusarium oxysporum]KAI8419660.1 hypothetical protein FOFC_02250 [Fusarium oxysporum]